MAMWLATAAETLSRQAALPKEELTSGQAAVRLKVASPRLVNATGQLSAR